MSFNLHDIRTSYGRCVVTRENKTRFYNRFHELFVDGHPQIKQLFATTPYERRINVFKQALSMAILYAEDQHGIALDVLDSIKKRHARQSIAITATHYQHWRHSLLTALEECDPKFTPALKAQWQEVLTITTDYLQQEALEPLL